MINMHQERIPATASGSNMASYEETYQQFSFEQIEKQFSWHETGKVNMAYEAIDRHVDRDEATRSRSIIAITHGTNRIRLTRCPSSRTGLRMCFARLGIGKGDRVFIFMPRTPELYFSSARCLKVGAVVGPLFEAFMETAVKDRLQDSEAVRS